MPVTRSALAQQPCPGADSGSAPGTCCAIQPASVSMRAALAPSVPRLGVEHDAIQLGTRLASGTLAVLVPEELGVPQARAQHALVAGDDGPAAVVGREIGDHDEARRQLAVGVLQREVFLVRAHRGDQHLRRQRHEPLVDGAEQHDRPFDQAGDLVQQRRIVAQAQALVARQPGRAVAIACCRSRRPAIT